VSKISFFFSLKKKVRERVWTGWFVLYYSQLAIQNSKMGVELVINEGQNFCVNSNMHLNQMKSLHALDEWMDE
jgi:hypothetical protein